MFESKVFLSVLINSENEEPITRDLTLSCVHWSAFHRYGSGVARSDTASVSVNYGNMSAKAYVTDYDDPGPTFAEWSHGDIGKVFDALLRDLGAKDCVREVKLIEMLLGDDTKAHLHDMIAGEFGPLSKVIDEKQKDSIRPFQYGFSPSDSHSPFSTLTITTADRLLAAFPHLHDNRNDG